MLSTSTWCSPPAASENSKVACAQHLRQIMSAEFSRVECALAAEFDKVLTQYLEPGGFSPGPLSCHAKADCPQEASTFSGESGPADVLSVKRPQFKQVQLANNAPNPERRFAEKGFYDCEEEILLAAAGQVWPMADSSQGNRSPRQTQIIFGDSSPVTLGKSSLENAAARISKDSKTISNTNSNRTMSDNAPQSAVVINVRRLVDVHSFLSLLHELVKSTAIAAITLVAAGTPQQFCSTVIFMLTVLTLYAMHEADWDRLDIEDLKTLLPLLIDDVDPTYDGDNPNRLLKAISISTNPLDRYIWHVCHLVLGCIAVIGWLSLDYYWRDASLDQGSGRKLEESVLTKYFVDLLIAGADDAMAFGMQLMVGTLMYLLELLFSYIHWRETAAVMPRTSSGEAWDPRRHGAPMKYWLFGLPSMWFTSEETWQKLKKYIDMASPGTRVRAIYPQEFAYWALSGDEERGELQKAFWDAKLFDGCSQRVVTRGNGDAEALNIVLCFFDNKRQRQFFPYPGDFQYFVDQDEVGAENSNIVGKRSKGSALTTNPSANTVRAMLRRVLSGVGSRS